MGNVNVQFKCDHQVTLTNLFPLDVTLKGPKLPTFYIRGHWL